MKKHSRIITAIDIGSSLIKVMVLRVTERENGEKVSHVVGFGKAESCGIEHGYVVNHIDALRTLQSAMAEAEKNAKMRITEAYLAVGGEMLGALYAHGETTSAGPNQIITESDVRRAITYGTESVREQLVNMHAFREIPLRMSLDEKRVIGRVVGLQGNKLEVDTLVVTALKQQYDDLRELVHHAGIRLLDTVPASLASSFVSLTRVHKRMGAMLVDIGAETTTVTVFEDSHPVALIVFPVGSRMLTEDFAVHFRIAPEEADKLKRQGPQHTIYAKKKYDAVVDEYYTRLFSTIRDHFKRMKFMNILPAGIFLTGGGALQERAVEVARDVFELPARIVATPFEKSPRSISHEYLMTVYGVCIWAIDAEEEEDATGIPAPTKQKGTFMWWIKQFLP